jgi:hypothetical protein
MAIHAGFDMVPRLTKSEADKESWAKFLRLVKYRFQDYDVVFVKDNFIEIGVGQHPRLPLEGHKLLRFSTELEDDDENQLVIFVIAELAELVFKTRINRWDETIVGFGFYGPQEVRASFKAYHQVSYHS